MNRKWTIGLIAYGLMGVFTFGHSAANTICPPNKPSDGCEEQRPLGGFIASTLWPLYWSWELQS